MLKAVSVLGLIGMAAGFLGLLAIQAVFSPSVFVVAPQATALALFLWARFTFGRRSFHAAANPTEGGLVTRGPYRYIRHPIYTSICVFAWAGIAAHWSSEACLFGVLVVLGALARIFAEEKLVSLRYPEYADYSERTWRMIPYVF
jgi:protein-S-isoprenylcysteine O-methyltransferase Ste14